jgi:hypothetical protein
MRLKRWIDAMSRRESVREIANDAAYYVQRYTNYAKSVLPAIASRLH